MYFKQENYYTYHTLHHNGIIVLGTEMNIGRCSV